jgi:hypothetical protein
VFLVRSTSIPVPGSLYYYSTRFLKSTGRNQRGPYNSTLLEHITLHPPQRYSFPPLRTHQTYSTESTQFILSIFPHLRRLFSNDNWTDVFGLFFPKTTRYTAPFLGNGLGKAAMFVLLKNKVHLKRILHAFRHSCTQMCM